MTQPVYTGNNAMARAVIDSLKISYQKASPFYKITLKAVEAMCDWSCIALFDSCLKNVQEGLELAEEHGVHIWDTHLLENGISVYLSMGDIPGAERMFERLSPYMRNERKIDICLHEYLLMWCMLIKKDTAGIAVHLESLQRYSQELGLFFGYGLVHLISAHVLHELHKDKEAKTHIAGVLHIARKMHSRPLEFAAYLTEALIAFDNGKDTQGLNALRKALSLGKENGYWNCQIWRQDVMSRLCAIALENRIEVDYVRKLIRKRNITPPIPLFGKEGERGGVETWPYPIKIYTLGRFEIVKNDKPVEFTGKIQKKPLELLKAFIAFGGRDVGEEQLTDALWPDADGDVAHSTFKSNLHRLRQLIGNEDALTVKEGRVTLDPRYCWVDAWVFENIFRDKSIQVFEKAIVMYRGHFLHGDSEQPWLISKREALKSKFMEIVSRLGNYYEGTKEFDKAVEFYKKGIETDNLVEEFYQRLITCYKHLGKKNEAIRVYRRCKDILNAVLNVEPSQETNAIYKALLK